MTRARTKAQPTFGSLFTGIGGFDLGFERAGLRCAWQIENDPRCCSVLARHWPTTPRGGDIRFIAGDALEPVDVLCGGFPCQDLSIAGKRAGLAGDRSGLFWEFARIIREMRSATNGTRPTLVAIEQVPGLLSSQRGADFGALLDALADLGALDIGWAILDAQWFGVAQRRRRVFLIIDFGGGRADEVLALTEGLRGDPPPRRDQGQRPPADPEDGPVFGRVVSPTLRPPGKGGATYKDEFAPVVKVEAYGGNDTRGAREVSSGLSARGGAGRMDFDTETFVVQQAEAFNWQAAGGGNDQSWGGKPRAWVTRAGDYTGAIGSTKRDAVAIGFSSKDSGGDARDETAPTLRAMVHDQSWANGGGQAAVSIGFYSTQGARDPSLNEEISPPLKVGSNIGLEGTAAVAVSPIQGEATTHSGVGAYRHPGLGVGEDGDPMYTLHGSKHHAVAVSLRGREGGATAEMGGPASPAIRASQGGGDKPHVLAFTERGRPEGQRLEHQADIAYALTNPGEGGRSTSRAIAIGAVSENQRAEVRVTDVARSITDGGGKPGQGYPAAIVGPVVRRLTPRECERLQGFPDDWTRYTAEGKEIPDGPRYRMLGNAVVVNVAHWLGLSIVAALKREGRKR